MVDRNMTAGLPNWPADYGDNNGGDDKVTGTSDNENIVGGAGNDQLFGQGGNDVISGGLGNDIISGGAGNDIIDPGPGNDTVFGGPGDDIISFGEGTDTIFGGDGVDTFVPSGPGGGVAVQFALTLSAGLDNGATAQEFEAAENIAKIQLGIQDLGPEDMIAGLSPGDSGGTGEAPPDDFVLL
jgi:Ca2+-binding RTX toxin-like protein